MKEIRAVIVVLLIALVLFFFIGTEGRQRTIEQRALKVKQKECYTWQDIEIIVHGEIQE